jgi:hypothetical protein
MEFNSESLTLVQDIEGLQPGWNGISLDQLQNVLTQYEESGTGRNELGELFNAIDMLTYLLSGVGCEDFSNILSAKIDEDFLVERVYGPCIQSDDKGGIVFCSGNIQIPCQLKDGEITIGSLSGDVEISEEKTESGDKYIKAQWSHLAESETIEVYFILDKDSSPTKASIKKSLKDGTTAHFLRVAGAGNFVDVRTLKRGDYIVKGIEERPVHEQYGRQWNIDLEGIGVIGSRGSMERSLKTKTPLFLKRIEQGLPVTLFISKVEAIDEKRTRVTADFFTKSPRPELLIAGNAKQPKQITAEPQQKELVGTAVNPADITF